MNASGTGSRQRRRPCSSLPSTYQPISSDVSSDEPICSTYTGGSGSVAPGVDRRELPDRRLREQHGRRRRRDVVGVERQGIGAEPCDLFFGSQRASAEAGSALADADGGLREEVPACADVDEQHDGHGDEAAPGDAAKTRRIRRDGNRPHQQAGLERERGDGQTDPRRRDPRAIRRASAPRPRLRACRSRRSGSG